MKSFIKRFVKRQYNWSIGIYFGKSPFDFVAIENINNPVLTAKDVTDVPASFVADPFMICENGTWYMFFEVMNAANQQGEIGLAISDNGLNWNYQQIVLKESFHLSYPYVFKWNDEYYMIPETRQTNSIRLYKAVNFPNKWLLEKTLIDGKDYADSSVFYFNSKWWLFTASKNSSVLHLYYADELTDFWREHPKSPIIKDSNIARPGGRVVVSNSIIRYSQDNKYIYGHKIRAFEITELSLTTYQEKEASNHPVAASGIGWNKTGMHTIDPHQIEQDKWIACVDGYAGKVSFFGLQFDSTIGISAIGFLSQNFAWLVDSVARLLTKKS
ncbi:MAG: hypothetical protein KME05_03450 [Gloeocapsa sp. UFS-A4-WI-NPMV-4B04]|nr:hypothetical protein [Gloeocapsa sp. UFS-A4-WI-NPMV-4B04]